MSFSLLFNSASPPHHTVKAHDGDRGINNPIHYSILSGGNGLFAINEKTGVIFSRKTLDREDSRNQENGAYILEIQATEISKIKVLAGNQLH